MSERGVFAVDRGIWDHPAFADEPLTEREAWQWLIGEASFKARSRNIAGRVVELKRGQLAASVRFMADRWKWGKSSVGRFLAKLKTETMIGTDIGTGILVISICNYDKYQRVSLPTGTQEGTLFGTGAGQRRDKREDTEDIEGSAAPNGARPEKSEEAGLFERGKKVLGKGAGGFITNLLKAKGGSIPLARAAIEQAATKHDPREYIGRIINGPRAGPVVLMENGQPHPDGIV